MRWKGRKKGGTRKVVGRREVEGRADGRERKDGTVLMGRRRSEARVSSHGSMFLLGVGDWERE
jgi:hypothetical protein